MRDSLRETALQSTRCVSSVFLQHCGVVPDSLKKNVLQTPVDLLFDNSRFHVLRMSQSGCENLTGVDFSKTVKPELCFVTIGNHLAICRHQFLPPFWFLCLSFNSSVTLQICF